MKVRILKGESAGQILDLPADFARRLLILGEVGRVEDAAYEAATLRPNEEAVLRRVLGSAADAIDVNVKRMNF